MELGGYFIEADPRCWEHIDFTILRIRVGVKSKEVVLPCRNMNFVEDDCSHRFYDLLFQVEDELAFQRTSNIGKIRYQFLQHLKLLFPCLILSFPNQ
jgi:hypothetical protein